MLLAQGLRVVLQAIYFIVIARALGIQQYGAFVGITSLISILGPYAGLGTEMILVKNVSRNRLLFNECWGNALFMIFCCSFILIFLILLTVPLIFQSSISLVIIFIVAVSDLIFNSILFLSGQAFQAFMRLKETAILNVILQVNRLFAALSFITLFSDSGILGWSILYLISTAISTLISYIMVSHHFGLPKLALLRLKSEINEAFYFSIGVSSQTIYNDIDKTLLSRLSSLEATGLFAAAYRLIDVAFIPVRSLMYAAYAKFFQQGSTGIKGVIRLTQRLLPMAGIYGVISGIGIFVFAPIVPYILGNEYTGVVEALRWLAPLPLFKAIHYFAADTLTGSGFQGLRSIVQVIVAVFNILANLWLIPLYSWQGAAWSSLASDALLIIGLWLTVMLLYRQQNLEIKDNRP